MDDKIIRRLGQRLNHIFQWINSANTYSTIWDICCDHGRLGLHLHQRFPTTHIHLVDKVASIINTLETDYASLNDGRLHFIAADATRLSLPAEQRSLVIIAGVGGQNLQAILKGIIDRLKKGSAVEFILSPNSHTFELRSFLREQHFTLIEESFVTEKNFSHEHLWLRYHCGRSPAQLNTESFQPVTIIGDSLWRDMSNIKRTYIHKLIRHYERMQSESRLSLCRGSP
jgi:Predicted SAM-dependent methyltransferase